MSTMPQVGENLASAGRPSVNSLTTAELALIDRVRVKYRELCAIPCTRCCYCMPCPNGVDIPRNFEVYNAGVNYQSPDWARNEYNKWIPQEARASVCIQCRECEDKCPQHILISEWMPVIQRVLGENQPYVTKLE
jgi:predicted aldo/keto reductase-like oxidoreductase